MRATPCERRRRRTHSHAVPSLPIAARRAQQWAPPLPQAGEEEIWAPPLPADHRSPLRVAFVLPSFAGGGAERVLLMLAGALDRARFAPEIVVLDGIGPWSAFVPAGM